ncbi:YadA-like family protein [Paraburkholderia sp. C35]|uniref:YadA family autotransporter adhesin n=1 Tax=Paraburkholderia sp. C35 TaxID=2126993 RepID=UPI001EF47D04|nr:YadA-like family protein [Paraburkholderia sp. C35]
MPAWAYSIANSGCTPDGPGSGTWSNVAGCYTDAGADGSLLNLGETVIGSYGYVPTNISFGTIFGFAGQANAMYGTALGANGVVSSGAQNSVALGAGSVATDPNTVSVGRVGNNPLYNVHTGDTSTGQDAVPMNQSLLGTLNRRVTNMAAGINDTDAVNVSQLKGVTKALGGGAGVNSDGSVKAPTYVVQGSSFSDVGSALSKLDTATTANSTTITNIQNTVNNITNGGVTAKYFHANSTQADSLASGANSVAAGDRANSMGGSSVAVGDGATAVGAASIANGNNASNTATANNSMSIGGGAMAGDKAMALGNGSTATGQWSVAAGANSAAAGAQASAFGSSANASGTQAVALGTGAAAAAANSVALGAYSTTTANLGAAGYNPGTSTLSGVASAANGEVSVGSAARERRITNVAAGSAATDAVNVSQLQSEDAKVNADGAATAAALGGGASYNPATGNISAPTYIAGGTTYNNVAGAITNLDGRVTSIGNNVTNLNNQVTNIVNGGGIKYFHANSTGADSTAAGANSVAVGPAATASASTAVALGANSVADRANTVSVGSSTAQRQVVNMAAGTANNDAVNVSQLKGVTAALGGGAAINADGSVKAPVYNVYGNTFTNVGDALSSISNATNGISDTLKYVKFGPTSADVAQASATDSLAIGGAAFSTGQGAGAIGTAARATYSNSVAIGYGSFATAANTFAVGGSAASQTRRIVNVADGINDSDAATVGQVNSDIQTAINNLKLSTTQTKATLLTAIGSAASATAASPVALGSVTAATEATDAVNYAQWNAAIAAVQNAATGSDAMLAVDGDRNTEAASVNGTHAMAIGPSASATATQAIASGYNAQASGDSAIALGANAKATADHAVALGDGSVADRANTVSVGSVGNERQITNVAAGTQTTDAVNVGQLNSSIAAAIGDMPAGMTAKDYTDQQIQQVQAGVNDVARNAYSGIAAATALTMIPDVDQGKTIAVGIGGASYHGYAASALGMSARITQNIKVKAGAGISAQGTTFGIGGAYQW